MNILVIGSGGREHALGWKLSQSPKVERVFFAPGNGGTSLVGENVDIGVLEVDKLREFAIENGIGFTVVGQEASLEVGIVDSFTRAGLAIFGPTKSAARLETSKVFIDQLLEKHDIPRPKSVAVDNIEDGLSYIKNRDPYSYVIKADGLATGKGVILPESEEEAVRELTSMMSGQSFGKAGESVVFQEKLVGQEVSAFALSDGTNIIMLPFFQDHKQAYDGDTGPNTGGMGAFTPVPFLTDEIKQKIRTEIMQKTVDGMKADGHEYRGVVYAGLFVNGEDVKVIEFNARFGDPECQPMMMSLEEDLLPLLQQAAAGKFTQTEIKTSSEAIATVCLASGGYPYEYEKGKEIFGLDGVSNTDIVIFHAGTKFENDKFYTNGGRVLNVTARADSMKAALNKAYSKIGEDGIHFDQMHFRSDIGFRVL